MAQDTLFALASAAGRAAVAVVRLSGPGASAAIRALTGRLPAPRRASLAHLKSAKGGILDQALVLWFPAPHSYTGEDSGEFHLHGGPAVVEAVQQALLDLGLRPAGPGEFTRRAFENGKLDLAQAEGVADLIDAETAAQAAQALAQLDGALSRRHEAWRAALIDCLALLEAAVDFPDDEIPADVLGAAREGLRALRAELEEALADRARGRRVREGFRIAVIGAPNAGKSSLFNALIEREAAIVTATPGTTRDVIEAPLVVDGYKVILADTAGVRETDETIEAEGVRRARAWAEGADLRLWVVDGSAKDGAWAFARDLVHSGDLCLINKADLASGPDAAAAASWASEHGLKAIAVAVKAGQGLDAVGAVVRAVVVPALSSREFPAATRLRHAESLAEARDRISAALTAGEVELAAEDVRLAARALGRITGRIDAEDVLDAVFGKFCIGK